jgi:hypothetical protein
MGLRYGSVNNYKYTWFSNWIVNYLAMTVINECGSFFDVCNIKHDYLNLPKYGSLFEA